MVAYCSLLRMYASPASGGAPRSASAVGHVHHTFEHTTRAVQQQDGSYQASVHVLGAKKL